MAENPPISTEVPETVTVDTGADKESLGNLNKDFADFWTEQDSEAPPAPGGEQSGAAQETVKEAPAKETEPKREVKPPESAGLTDEEIDKLQLRDPHAKPELQDQFKNIKTLWMSDRAKLQAELDKSKQLEAQLAEAKANAWSPETKADYEHAASIRRRFDFVSDPEFIQRFHVPVRAQFESILDEVTGMLPDRQAALEWANYIKANYQPDALSRDWWVQSVVNKVPNELDRSTLLNSISRLIACQKERDTEIHRRTADKSSFENWINEKTQFTAKRVQEEIMAEIGEQEKRIQEVLPRDIASAKTPDERKAIETHNARFNRLNEFFQNTMKDISANGPRAWVRASVEATRAKLLEEAHTELEAELKTVKSERDRYKSELDRITGARRKITHTTGTPPATQQPKNGSQGLSIKDLGDPRKAMESYWGEIDSKQ
jgi:hypothetical protein